MRKTIVPFYRSSLRQAEIIVVSEIFKRSVIHAEKVAFKVNLKSTKIALFQNV